MRLRKKGKRGGKARAVTGMNGKTERRGEIKRESGRAGNAEYIIPRKKMNHTADGISGYRVRWPRQFVGADVPAERTTIRKREEKDGSVGG